MKVQVTETKKASSDGVTIKEYQKGKTYDMPEGLAKVFLNNKWGKDPSKKPAPAETNQAPGPAEAKA